MTDRPHVLVLNQYYWPGVEATANLLSDLCESLAEDHDVTVITGMVRNAREPGRTRRHGVDIVRVPSTAFDRRRLSLRAVNYLTYLAQSLRHGLTSRRPDIVLCMTDPPVIGDVALVVAQRFRVPLVVVTQDVFPEVAVALGRLDNPALIGTLRRAIRFYLRRAERVVAIGDTMRQRLEEKGADARRLVVIPNWVDTKTLSPQPKDNRWSRQNDLADKFVVMHSGNVGHAQDLDAVVRAATFLRDLPDLRIVIVGGGARRDELVALAERLEVDQVLFLPYQPRDGVPFSLSSADIHVVGLARGLAGYVVPSRLYGILSVARPVIAAAEPESETAKVVETAGCGVVVPPGRPELLAREIRRAHDGELDLTGMGALGRAYVVAEADRAVAVARYRRLLRDLATRGAAS